MKGEPFLEDLESLEQAIASFIHLSFVAQIKYPQVREIQGTKKKIKNFYSVARSYFRLLQCFIF
jgi:hypothetical protein